MSLLNNLDIRMTLSDKGITYRQVAAEMGITPVYLSRLMADDLRPSMRERVLAAIDSLANQENTETSFQLNRIMLRYTNKINRKIERVDGIKDELESFFNSKNLKFSLEIRKDIIFVSWYENEELYTKIFDVKLRPTYGRCVTAEPMFIPKGPVSAGPERRKIC